MSANLVDKIVDNLEALEEALSAAIKEKVVKKIVIQSDNKTHFQLIQSIMDVCVRLGIDDIKYKKEKK